MDCAYLSKLLREYTDADAKHDFLAFYELCNSNYILWERLHFLWLTGGLMLFDIIMKLGNTRLNKMNPWLSF